MNETEKYFGYDKSMILELFRRSADQVDSNCRISQASTLSQLVESSEKMLRDDNEFLHKIFDEMD